MTSAVPADHSAGVGAVQRRSRSKTPIIVLMIVLFLIIGVVAAAAFLLTRKAPAIPVTVEKATVRTITQLVSATGKIQPEVEVKISPEVAGEIVDLPFPEGASVKKGDLLVGIKPDNYQAQVEQQQAGLAAAKATSLQAKAQLEKAQQDFRDSDDLFRKGVVSTSDHNSAKAQLDIAQANYDADLAQIRRAEGSLNQALDLLSKTKIYAPMDGTISQLSSEVGERVVATSQFAGTEVMRIANLDNMEVRVNVNENDVVHVKVGDRARITIDAFAGRQFTGTVTEVASTATVTGQNTQDEVTNFQVKIRVDGAGAALRPGMSASADIETATVANVVSVPIQSVTVRSIDGSKTLDQLTQEREKEDAAKSGGNRVNLTDTRDSGRNSLRDKLQRVVFVKEGGVVKMRPVEMGISDNGYVEIKSGVKAGEEVVSGTYAAISRRLKDGANVEIEKPKKGKL